MPQGHKLYPLKAFFLGHVTLLGTRDSLRFSSGSQLEKWPLLFLIIEVPSTHKIKKEALYSEHVTVIQYILNIVQSAPLSSSKAISVTPRKPPTH